MCCIDKGIFALPQMDHRSRFTDPLIGLIKKGLLSSGDDNPSLPFSLTNCGIAWNSTFKKLFFANNEIEMVSFIGKTVVDIRTFFGQDASAQIACLTKLYAPIACQNFELNEIFLVVNAYKIMFDECISRQLNGYFNDFQNGFSTAIHTLSLVSENDTIKSSVMDYLLIAMDDPYRAKKFDDCVALLNSWISNHKAGGLVPHESAESTKRNTSSAKGTTLKSA
jgi:hypothetical protein